MNTLPIDNLMISLMTIILLIITMKLERWFSDFSGFDKDVILSACAIYLTKNYTGIIGDSYPSLIRCVRLNSGFVEADIEVNGKHASLILDYSPLYKTKIISIKDDQLVVA